MKPRKPWLAALLSLICPGLGQLYNGDVLAAFAALVIGTLLAALSSFYLFDSLGKLLQAILYGLAVDIFFAAHAWWRAKQVGTVELKSYQRWWIYAGFAIIVYGLPDGYGVLYPERFLSFQIPSESMVPTLLVGDRLVADGWAFLKAGPKRGDIIVFDYPRDPKVKFVKRVVGLPGDEISVVAGELFINKVHVHQLRKSEPAAMNPGLEGNQTELIETLGDIKHRIYRMQPGMLLDYGPRTVPADNYFVMGDNRDRSSDSRVWGFVPRAAIVGQMKYVYFSWDSLKGALRKERIGEQVN